MIPTRLYRLMRPTARTTAAVMALTALTTLAIPSASAHEGHGAVGEVHAHGDALWGLALLAAVVLIGLFLGKRR